MDDYIREFLAESHENMAQTEQDLVTLESNPTDKELIDSVFRNLHTIKGTCGYLGFNRLEVVSHAGENLLSHVRSGDMALGATHTDALLSVVDAIKNILVVIEENETDGDNDYADLIQHLGQLAIATDAPSQAVANEQTSVATADSEPAAAGAALELEGELLSEFVMEGRKLITNAEGVVGQLMEFPVNDEHYPVAFRCFHSIRVSASFMQQHEILPLAKLGERILVGIHSGEFAPGYQVESSLLSLLDGLRAHLSAVEEQVEIPDSEMLVQLVCTQFGLEWPLEEMRFSADDYLATATGETGQALQAQPRYSPSDLPADPEGTSEPAAPGPPADEEPSQVAEAPEPTVESPQPKSEKQEEAAYKPTQEVSASAISEGSVRVDVNILDQLMNLVGELVLARNQLLLHKQVQEDAHLQVTSQYVSRVTAELQEMITKTRMQPISNIWNHYPRIVRDLAQSLDKKVNIEMKGETTELDRSVIEAIKDPLSHIIRNCIDHGIESPDARVSAGKEESGYLLLDAYHKDGMVNIEISDDGGGIPLDKVLQKAVNKSVVTPEEAASLTDREILELLFRPGFTTAEQVTNISGRGVGMDVVRTNIEQVGGTLDIQSQAGQGTTLRIKIPLTLAIIPALVVESGGDRFAIPQLSLLEVVRIEETTTRKSIEVFQGAPICRLRDQLLPLVFLNRELDLIDDQTALFGAKLDGTISIVVLQVENQTFGLVVDSILDTQEIVVKPLPPGAKDLKVYAGATIMGDGKVALILDVLGLAHRSHAVVAGAQKAGSAEKETDGDAASVEPLLLVENSRNEWLVMKMERVLRLEMIPVSRLEISGSQNVIQYRNSILPLFHLDEGLEGQDSTAAKSVEELITGEDSLVPIVVCEIDNAAVGLVVRRIVDVIRQEFVVKDQSPRRFVHGRGVIQERVAELLDITEFLSSTQTAG
ncbi:MAG: chemotaxis protein CheA [Planctomycetota bacterium]|nr:chemotaxis protein CheA [Planctomycetota bacterium]